MLLIYDHMGSSWYGGTCGRWYLINLLPIQMKIDIIWYSFSKEHSFTILSYYHTSLPYYLSEKLEYVQKPCMKIIYPGPIYSQALEKAKLTTLYDQRNVLCHSFFFFSNDSINLIINCLTYSHLSESLVFIILEKQKSTSAQG